jgi:hypothetical protein
LWAEAVKKAGSTDIDKVKEAAKGLELRLLKELSRLKARTSTYGSLLGLEKYRKTV